MFLKTKQQNSRLVQVNHLQHYLILTHYQTINFRHFQTERVCRRIFQIWWKWQKAIQTGRKHCGQRRNCSLQAISPFSIVFSKGLFPRGIKRCNCEGIFCSSDSVSYQSNHKFQFCCIYFQHMQMLLFIWNLAVWWRIWASFCYSVWITFWVRHTSFLMLKKSGIIKETLEEKVYALLFEGNSLYIFFFLFLKIFLSLCNRLLLLVVFCVELITTL